MKVLDVVHNLVLPIFLHYIVRLMWSSQIHNKSIPFFSHCEYYLVVRHNRCQDWCERAHARDCLAVEMAWHSITKNIITFIIITIWNAVALPFLFCCQILVNIVESAAIVMYMIEWVRLLCRLLLFFVPINSKQPIFLLDLVQSV